MKKIISLLVVFCIVLSAASAMAVNDVITLMVNGSVIETDVVPYIKNDRTMVPMRAIFEALGALVTWDDTTKTACGVKGETEVKITVGENKLYKNGAEIALDSEAEIVNNRTMVPVRAISEAFGANVQWNNHSRTVLITFADNVEVIYVGTHAIYEDDPYYTNPETGERYMDEKTAEAKIYALNKVKQTLGVEIKFVQYPTSDYRTVISESIENGEPFCELATLWGGSQKSAIDKDIIQPIDDYINIFGEEAFPLEKTEGHYYFMSRDFNYINTWPIVYNMTMLDKIPELKEDDGTTLYPAEMYYRGEWTWSNFEKYLSIINEYCENNTSSFTIIPTKPFETNYAYFVQGALHSVGASVYDGENVQAGNDEAVKAVEFAKGLFEKGLVSCASAEKHSNDTGWISGTSDFLSRETYFTNCARWRIDDASTTLKMYGNTMGTVPFPYPDGTNPFEDGSCYRHVNSGSDSIGLVKGIDKSRGYIAVMAYKTYMVEYCKALGGTDSVKEFIEKYAETDAQNYGIDTIHPEVGELHAKIWAEYGKTPVNEYSEAFELFWKWSSIFGEYAFADGSIDEYKESVEGITK